MQPHARDLGHTVLDIFGQLTKEGRVATADQHHHNLTRGPAGTHNDRAQHTASRLGVVREDVELDGVVGHGLHRLSKHGRYHIAVGDRHNAPTIARPSTQSNPIAVTSLDADLCHVAIVRLAIGTGVPSAQF